MEMSREEIKRTIIECIEELFTKDWCILENDVSERAITHKLAEYLQHRIPYLNVDCEYNRNATEGIGEPKLLSWLKDQDRENTNDPNLDDDEKLSVSAYPDIIVHRRMINAENLLVVEVKKRKSQVNHSWDHKKLTAFTENSQQNSYHFQYGVFIILDTGPTWRNRKPDLVWFVEGQIDRNF